MEILTFWQRFLMTKLIENRQNVLLVPPDKVAMQIIWMLRSHRKTLVEGLLMSYYLFFT